MDSGRSAAESKVLYVCGGIRLFVCSYVDCGSENEIKPKDPIRCRDCGYRIMYKKRTKRVVQFEAR